ncbi:leucine-rich repeat containing protein [Entamoeba histolytica HM-1:IMSS-B]|uniref:Leucine-rich repeat containing protein n=6 Tax=Entamoeba histolytica TaxID=5759 RepID=C4M017_ENTH1|nr:uncharacterized protein EHI_134680 [Entamoeba histolytica HM-1:IMSS]EMD47950.1 leucinerich repeat-containing protein [Entamoeba histolytica KU27]EMH73442.1 leucine-rich repeat containing protein [Entamoeba histolytica HM-1:IMSS-B]EMS14391.1 Leucine-rich repeat containing protein [Entamoeba histolytica HM-3:IMSS]ENY62719.1 Leucine-rich repeat containing protein [Entamoeba histolytica HM-1:IMSS-A]GAT94484.1 leucine-rich repeat containing protein [Entamoeba histolytica]|eukprot:XP_652118.1 uncharacterized protein EHI_134680 [Entamoeba histolytica HM-1:IMSS]
MISKLGELLKPKNSSSSLLETLKLQLDLFYKTVENKNENGYVCINCTQVVFLNTICAPQTIDPTLSMMLSQISKLSIGDDDDKPKEIEGTILELSFLEKTNVSSLEITTKQPWHLPNTLQCRLKELKVWNMTKSQSDNFFNILKKREEVWENLEVLKLSNCEITKIPEDVFSALTVPHLKILDLSKNQIAVLENIRERPMDLIDVSTNVIEFIDIQFVGSISQLVIDNNLLTSLDGCRPFFNLQRLSVRNNLIESFQNMKRAFSKLFSLTDIHLEGNPVVEDEHFIDKIAELLPSSQFGIDSYVNGNKVDLNPHKYVNTSNTTKPSDQSVHVERKNIGLSLLDDEALLEVIKEKVELFRKGSWDYTEDEYKSSRSFLREVGEKINQALIETEYSLVPDVEVFPYSTVKKELCSSLLQTAYCRKEKRCFVQVSGVNESQMEMVVKIPIVSSNAIQKALQHIVQLSKDLENEETSIELNNNLFGVEINVAELVKNVEKERKELKDLETNKIKEELGWEPQQETTQDNYPNENAEQTMVE